MEYESNVTTVSLTVPRTARYARMGPEGGAVEQVWLVCHGYGQLADRFIRRFSAIDDGSRLIIAPEALSRFYVSGGSVPHAMDAKVGASWMTREARDAEIEDQVTYLDLLLKDVLRPLDQAPTRVVALGFSQGAAVVCRWAARTAAPPDQLVVWGSGIPADVLEGQGRDRLARIAITIVVGTRDSIATGARVDAHKRQLDEAGLDYSLITFDGGHEIDESALRQLAGNYRD